MLVQGHHGSGITALTLLWLAGVWCDWAQQQTQGSGPQRAPDVHAISLAGCALDTHLAEGKALTQLGTWPGRLGCLHVEARDCPKHSGSEHGLCGQHTSWPPLLNTRISCTTTVAAAATAARQRIPQKAAVHVCMNAHVAIGATRPCSPVHKGPECCRAEPLLVKAEVPVLVHCRATAPQQALSILSGAGASSGVHEFPHTCTSSSQGVHSRWNRPLRSEWNIPFVYHAFRGTR